MKVLQPIEWQDENGKTKRGIVTEMLGDLNGVIARSIDNPMNGVLVKKPHKITDMDNMMEIWKALGVAPSIVANAGFLSKPMNHPVPAAKTDVEMSSTFDKAMAEIEAMFSTDPAVGVGDKLFLNSMGFNFAEGILPNASKEE